MHWGHDPALEKHYVPTRSQRARSVLTFFAQDSGTIAVGTALAGGPPHRSQRAGLPHWAPASDTNVEARFGIGMQDAGRGQPSGENALHPLPCDSVTLAAAP